MNVLEQVLQQREKILSMRYEQTCASFADLAHRQSVLAVKAPGSFFAGAMMAGGFVGIAMILALSVGAHLDPSIRPLAMGAVFGISILLAVFGGGELFTGQVMFATFGLLRGKLSLVRAMHLLLLAWLGNLGGAVLICSLFAIGGGGHVYGSAALLHDLVSLKSQSPAVSLLARAILCNWLACLGIWTASRLASDSAKMVILAWCVMAYVACGLEHSIANTALFTLGLLAPTAVGGVGSIASSVAIVSLGNLIGGSLLVAGAYALYSRGERSPAMPDTTIEDLELKHMPPQVQASVTELVRQRVNLAA